MWSPVASSGAAPKVVALSRDGTQLAYVASGALHVKSMAELEPRIIYETPSGIANPTFSPDSRSIAFWSLGDRTIRRVAVTGGSAVVVTTTADFFFFGMSWDESGILWGEGSRGIMRNLPGRRETREAREGQRGRVGARPTDAAGWPRLALYDRE